MEWRLVGRTESARSVAASRGDALEQVPNTRWREVLSEFVEDYKGAPVSIQIVEVGGCSRTLEVGTNEDLRLMSIVAEPCEGALKVRLYAHKHPGAEIAQIEFSGGVELARAPARFWIRAADGFSMEVRVSCLSAR